MQRICLIDSALIQCKNMSHIYLCCTSLHFFKQCTLQHVSPTRPIHKLTIWLCWLSSLHIQHNPTVVHWMCNNTLQWSAMDKPTSTGSSGRNAGKHRMSLPRPASAQWCPDRVYNLEMRARSPRFLDPIGSDTLQITSVTTEHISTTRRHFGKTSIWKTLKNMV